MSGTSDSAATEDPVTGLLQALAEEREALIANRPELLPPIAARKQRLLQGCELLATSGSPKLRRALAVQLAKARALNDDNAILLAPLLSGVRARIEVLAGATRTVYGANGRTPSAFGAPRRSLAV